MSHALLLRLFLSPSFFSVHVALRYLILYADNIGITYYLTRRLRELDTHELREVWGFICHLLVTRPSKSRALECFVAEVAQRSTHLCMTTLWFMQASLKDLSLTHHRSQSFVVCQRVLHKCYEIIFGDLPPSSPGPYSSLCPPFQSRFMRRKVKPHVEPALIGLGVVLAGASAMPRLTEVMGEVVIEQGRMEDDGDGFKGVETHDDEVVQGYRVNFATDSFTEDDEDNGIDETSDETSAALFGEATLQEQGLSGDDNKHVAGPGSVRYRRTIGAAQTAPALPLHLQNIRRSRLSEDPLGQRDPTSPVRSSSPYQSTPSISSLAHSESSYLQNPLETLLQRYDLPSQAHLLRSHYCRSVVQFLLCLEAISNRLMVVPRPARVSALRAELTALNHKLPAEVCIPMWCSSSDTPQLDQDHTQPHHRIVRIPPGESVVLNSAERAPYLLFIEILHDDLDFRTSVRGNKEILKRIVAKEAERSGASHDLVSFTPLAYRDKRPPERTDTSHALPEEGRSDTHGTSHVVIPVTLTTPDFSKLDDEEIDLVEQLYGSDRSLRTQPVDLSESIILPPTLKNKALDMATWSRSSSIPSSPLADSGSNTPQRLSTSTISQTGPQSFPPCRNHIPGESSMGSDNIRKQILSLDEYSERMRTAAIMLSQLNANLIREPLTTIPTSVMTTNISEAHSDSGALGWLSGPRWLSNSVDQPPGDPVERSFVSGSHDPSAAPPTRMKLQHAEASAIRDRIMKEMLSLEEERMERMRENRDGEAVLGIADARYGMKNAEDDGIIRRELNRADPSAIVFSESWAAKKSRIRHGSPYGHLANWDCVSVIVKTGADLRQEQLAVQLIQEFATIWREENCQCWVRSFRILITGGTSGLVETITDAVSIHSIKKAEYARRLNEVRLGYVTLFDHFKTTYGDPSSAKFVRAQRNFAKSLAGYSIVTYLLQIKDRHNGNILLDREGHLIHIDFGFMLSNSPGNIGFEAAPFKLPPEYIEVLGGTDGGPFQEFKRHFREGFEASRKHCDRIITLVELMQNDSTLPCFATLGDQTANNLRDRFQPALTYSLVGEYVDRLIDSSLGSNWTRLYDSYQYYSQSIL